MTTTRSFFEAARTIRATSRSRSGVEREEPPNLRTFIRLAPHLVPVARVFGKFPAGRREGGAAELENFHLVSPSSRSSGSSIRRVSGRLYRGGFLFRTNPLCAAFLPGGRSGFPGLRR